MSASVLLLALNTGIPELSGSASMLSPPKQSRRYLEEAARSHGSWQFHWQGRRYLTGSCTKLMQFLYIVRV